MKKYLHCFDSEITKKLVPKGSNSGKIYDLIKVHKNSNPARPVVSMIGTPEYKLANFFDSIIKSYLPDNHMLYSTEDFLEKLNQFKFKADHKLVRFDVQSLFINVLWMKLFKL